MILEIFNALLVGELEVLTVFNVKVIYVILVEQDGVEIRILNGSVKFYI